MYEKLNRVLGGCRADTYCLVFAVYSDNDSKMLEKERCRAGLKYKLKSTESQRTYKKYNVHHLTPAAFPTGGQF